LMNAVRSSDLLPESDPSEFDSFANKFLGQEL
jgi:hypothetical protein